MNYSNLFVCLMGLATVFIGLICIIILVSVMSSIVRKTDKVMSGKEAVHQPPAAAVESPVTPQFIAAVSAALAEDMGQDVSAFRIV